LKKYFTIGGFLVIETNEERNYYIYSQQSINGYLVFIPGGK